MGIAGQRREELAMEVGWRGGQERGPQIVRLMHLFVSFVVGWCNELVEQYIVVGECGRGS